MLYHARSFWRERERERRMGGTVHYPLFLTIQHLSVKFFLMKGGKKKLATLEREKSILGSQAIIYVAATNRP